MTIRTSRYAFVADNWINDTADGTVMTLPHCTTTSRNSWRKLLHRSTISDLELDTEQIKLTNKYILQHISQRTTRGRETHLVTVCPDRLTWLCQGTDYSERGAEPMSTKNTVRRDVIRECLW